MAETFVAKRWNINQRTYVDSKNNKLQTPKLISDLSTPSLPPANGSTPFLDLPTELRLQIYGYLTNNDTIYLSEFQSTFAIASSRSTAYAYLYRSPGRVTKPNAISRQVIDLFHVCRRMREELMDACFSDRTFVLEASLYQRDAGGLRMLPPKLGPTAWVKRLLLLTVVEVGGMMKGIGDLRPLQQMTNLREVFVVFSVRKAVRSSDIGNLERRDDIFRAVFECVPKEATVHFEPDDALQESLLTQLGPSVKYLFEKDGDADTDSTLASLVEKMPALKATKGKLSGSEVNHALCQYHACLEGLGCVNSSFDLPLSPSADLEATLKVNKGDDVVIYEAPKPSVVDQKQSSPKPEQKKCVHGFYRCYRCEKGLMQKIKYWSGY